MPPGGRSESGVCSRVWSTESGVRTMWFTSGCEVLKWGGGCTAAAAAVIAATSSPQKH